MNPDNRSAIASEKVGMLAQYRHDELKQQHWDREKSQLRAKEEGIELSDEHWAVLVYLRKNIYKLAYRDTHAIYQKRLITSINIEAAIKIYAVCFQVAPSLKAAA